MVSHVCQVLLPRMSTSVYSLFPSTHSMQKKIQDNFQCTNCTMTAQYRQAASGTGYMGLKGGTGKAKLALGMG